MNLFQIIVGKESTLFKQNEDITLTCEATGYPAPRVTWLKNKTPLKENDRIHVYENYTLLIKTATLIDGGEYTCRYVFFKVN